MNEKRPEDMTIEELKAAGLCVFCRQPALERCYSNAGRREVGISGVCELCFDEITKEED